MSKIKSQRRLILLLFSLLFVGTTFGQQTISVSDAWIRIPPPGMHMLAGYGTFVNLTDNPIELVDAQSNSFDSIGFHISEVSNGISSMRNLGSIVLLPGESTVFEPGGKHLMINAPQYVTQPDSVQIDFFDRAGSSHSVSFKLLQNAPERP